MEESYSKQLEEYRARRAEIFNRQTGKKPKKSKRRDSKFEESYEFQELDRRLDQLNQEAEQKYGGLRESVASLLESSQLFVSKASLPNNIIDPTDSIDCRECGQSYMQGLQLQHTEICIINAKYKQVYETYLMLVDDQGQQGQQDLSSLQCLQNQLIELAEQRERVQLEYAKKVDQLSSSRPRQLLIDDEMQKLALREQLRKIEEADHRMLLGEEKVSFKGLQAEPCKQNLKTQCSICMQRFQKGVSVLVLPCMHIYHQSCLRDWFSRTQKKCCLVDKYQLSQ